MPLHVDLTHMTTLPAHMQSVSKYLRARTDIFHLSHIIFHAIVSSSVRGSTGGSSSGRARASAGMWAQHCRQGTSPMKPDLVGIRGELCLARSPHSGSCHVSRGVPLLSSTPIGCRSGASVGSRRWLLLHALLLHNVRQPAHMRSDNPRLSNKRWEEGCTVLLGSISLDPLIRGWEVFYH